MSDKEISTIYIDNSKNIAFGRYCDLCGESFTVDLHEARTICPRCKDIWKQIIEKRERESEE